MELWAKLNLKDQDSVLVLGAPPDVLPLLDPPEGVRRLTRPGKTPVAFAIAFVTQESELEAACSVLLHSLEDDAVLWFAYPKKSSKRHVSTISRDSAWTPLGAAGYEPVRQVAIDEDWSALRFRKVAHITKMTRSASMILSEEGRERVARRGAAQPKRTP
jgi:hypothetical protein